MPKPPTGSRRRNNPDFSPVTAFLPNALGKRLRVFIAQQETTISEVVEQALKEYLDRYQPEITQPKSKPETIAEVVQENYYKLLTDGKIVPDNLKAIAGGEKPSNADLVRIAQILDIREENLLAMRDRIFPPKRR